MTNLPWIVAATLPWLIHYRAAITAAWFKLTDSPCDLAFAPTPRSTK
jgi:hypothetical protein